MRVSDFCVCGQVTVLDVRDYLVADGATDDTVAFRDLLASAAGSTVTPEQWEPLCTPNGPAT